MTLSSLSESLLLRALLLSELPLLLLLLLLLLWLASRDASAGLVGAGGGRGVAEAAGGGEANLATAEEGSTVGTSTVPPEKFSTVHFSYSVFGAALLLLRGSGFKIEKSFSLEAEE